MILFDPADHDPGKCQAVLSQVVVPRPIAMISTADDEGVVNVAPFSYYMPITGKPMHIGVTMGALRECDGQPKHTYTNAMRSGDFVVNVTSGRFAADIETAAMEFPDGESELAALGWTAVPSVRVSSPSVAESPAHLECLVRRVIDLGDLEVQCSGVHIVLAEVVCITLDEAVSTPDYRVDQGALAPIGRMGFPYFTRVDGSSLYELERVSYAESGIAGEPG
jgi:flavin reductase (DIM6/NTAB) family NADH-FMN oxidoreductase RutF